MLEAALAEEVGTEHERQRCIEVVFAAAGDEIAIVALLDLDSKGGFPNPTAGDYLGFYLDKDALSLSYVLSDGKNTGADIDINRKTFSFDAEISGTITGDESGLMNAYYPEGKREARPFPYFSEPWTGLEYHTAAGMIFENMETDGIKVVSSTRSRYDGTNRNPFNEGEFGHRYARAMSSWSPLIAYTRFHYQRDIGRMTIRAQDGTYFWSNGYSWGNCKIKKSGKKFNVELSILYGKLELKKFKLNGIGEKVFDKIKTVREGEKISATI